MVISKFEAKIKRKRYGTALMREFMTHCPPAEAMLIFAPGKFKANKAIPEAGPWEFLEAFGFERANGNSLLFSIPYYLWRWSDPQGFRELREEQQKENEP